MGRPINRATSLKTIFRRVLPRPATLRWRRSRRPVIRRLKAQRSQRLGGMASDRAGHSRGDRPSSKSARLAVGSHALVAYSIIRPMPPNSKPPGKASAMRFRLTDVCKPVTARHRPNVRSRVSTVPENSSPFVGAGAHPRTAASITTTAPGICAKQHTESPRTARSSQRPFDRPRSQRSDRGSTGKSSRDRRPAARQAPTLKLSDGSACCRCYAHGLPGGHHVCIAASDAHPGDRFDDIDQFVDSH